MCLGRIQVESAAGVELGMTHHARIVADTDPCDLSRTMCKQNSFVLGAKQLVPP